MSARGQTRKPQGSKKSLDARKKRTFDCFYNRHKTDAPGVTPSSTAAHMGENHDQARRPASVFLHQNGVGCPPAIVDKPVFIDEAGIAKNVEVAAELEAHLGIGFILEIGAEPEQR